MCKQAPSLSLATQPEQFRIKSNISQCRTANNERNKPSMRDIQMFCGSKIAGNLTNDGTRPKGDKFLCLTTFTSSMARQWNKAGQARRQMEVKMKSVSFRRLIDFVWSSPDLDRLWAIGILILRIYVGAAVLIAHGWPKLQEMLGGHGHFPELIESLGLPFPGLFAWLAIVSQVGGSLLVILGLWTRPAALAVGFTIAFGVLSVHWGDGFKGMELGLVYSVVLAVIAVSGPGWMSFDRAMRGKK